MVEVNGITKGYCLGYVLKDVCFTAPAQAATAILGRKGAGKTALADIVCGCSYPDSGGVRICGHDMAASPVKAKMSLGYMPQQPLAYPEMTPLDYLHFVCALRGITGEDARKRIGNAIEKAGIKELAAGEIRGFCAAEQKRLSLAGALCGGGVLVLDEPTEGLDPSEAQRMRDVISSLKGEHTVLLFTSGIHEATEVCDSIAVLCGGTITAREASKDILAAARRQRRLALRLKSDKRQGAALLESIERIERVETLGSSESGTCDYIADAPGGDVREDIFNACSAAGVALLGMERLAVTLDDIYSGLTGGGR